MNRAKNRVIIDKEKMRKALLRRHLTMSGISREHFYCRAWISAMVAQGYVTATAMEILKEYGITEEEIQP